MRFNIIFIILFKSCSFESLDSPKLLFIGQNYNDTQNMTIYSNFNKIFNSNYFNPVKSSVLIIHGFEGSYETKFAKTLVDAFLTRPEYNILFGDWSEKANGGYLSVVYVVSDVAQTFVKLLNKVQAFGYDLTKIYIVGHSLGAHMAGRIGSILQTQNVLLPRITGLDPAGPMFNWVVLAQKLFGTDVSFPRYSPLSKGNAKFVDIIHSNAGWFRGLVFSTGDVDFWPNGGSFQPSCTDCSFLSLFRNLDNCSKCNHLASAFYYAESVRSSSSFFIGKRCMIGSIFPSAFFCRGPSLASMGFHANSESQPGDYYLATRADAPYSY